MLDVVPMTSKPYALIAAGGILAVCVGLLVFWITTWKGDEQGHYDRGEMQVIVSRPPTGEVRLFQAGATVERAEEVRPFVPGRMWLPRGNYFFRLETGSVQVFYPAPTAGFGTGPETDGSLRITFRTPPSQTPPRPPGATAGFAFIPGGHFLMGDRSNPREQHYVFVTGFFIAPFETTNAEFHAFIADVDGYAEDAHWTTAGRHWKAVNHSQSSATLRPGSTEYRRFGQPGQPVTSVSWYEASAYCQWLTAKLGAGRWMLSLPTDAEWEKAARGPDNFDYGLSLNISDPETPLYNWKKNPGVPVTVVDRDAGFQPNRYGLYHMSGNVAEWTRSVFRPYGRQEPYVDDDRNRDETVGRRTTRGGSWYSATTAPLYLPYRDAFQPDHLNNDLGFRVVARLP